MITTAKEYFEALWRLNDGNIPSTALLLPKEESIYQINLDTRRIEAPEMLGVETDQTAEVIYFICDRFFGEMDLANTSCAIVYKNAKDEYGTYPVPFYDITTFSGNGSYLRVEVSIDTYEAGKYYIYNKKTKYYSIYHGAYDQNLEYYNYIPPEELEERHFIKAYVDSTNYQKGIYYIKNTEGKFEIYNGVYDRNLGYYSYADQPKILFPWVIGGRASSVPGKLDYKIEFYTLKFDDEDESSQYVYKLNTKTATTTILDTMVATKEQLDEEIGEINLALPSWQQEMQAKIDTLSKDYELYWIDADSEIKE